MSTPSARILSLCLFLALFWVRPGHAEEKITFTPSAPGQLQAKPAPCDIAVFQDAKPDRMYVELGVINYHDERHRTKAGSLKLEVALPKIKVRACKVGADALINIRVTEVRRLEFAMFNVSVTAVRFEPK